jgi:hypothetical protein
MMCNGRVHVGFGHADMTPSTMMSDVDSLSDINGQKHAGFSQANMQNKTKDRLHKAMMIH